MSNKTIAKFACLVILFAFVSVFLFSCSDSAPGQRSAVDAAELSGDFGRPATLGHIESPEIVESSGVAASLCTENVLWTHNDSGDDAFIFAINLQGKHLGTWRVTKARNEDWEDMATYKDASGTCYLYLGDIGNNRLERVEQRIYRVKEPLIPIYGRSSNKKNPLPTDAAEMLVFRYSDRPHDAETLMARPRTGEIYVLTKRFDGPSAVFRISPNFGSPSPIIAQQVGTIALPTVPNGFLTGGAISPDGKHAVVCDYAAGYVLDSDGSASFDDLWKQRPIRVDLGDRRQGEAITYSADGSAIITTSEKRNSPVIEVRHE